MSNTINNISTGLSRFNSGRPGKPGFRILGIVITIASFGAVGWFTFKAAQSGISFTDIRWFPFALAIALHLVVLMLLPLLWEYILRFLIWKKDTGEYVRPERLEIFKVYGRSWLARYIPGRIWMFGGRIILAKKFNIPVGVLTRSMFLEVFFSYSMISLIGAAIVLGLFTHILVGILAPVLAFMVLAGGFYMLQRKLGTQKTSNNQSSLLQKMQVFARKMLFGDSRLPFGDMVWGFGVYGIHACLQLVFIVLIAVSFVDLTTYQALVIAGGWALSITLGYIAFFVPGGLGVRDGLGLALFSIALDPPTAALIVAASRIVMVLADVLFVGVLEFLSIGAKLQHSRTYRTIGT
jgi:hypothetical protein